MTLHDDLVRSMAGQALDVTPKFVHYAVEAPHMEISFPSNPEEEC
jgi:hypothetical protein